MYVLIYVHRSLISSIVISNICFFSWLFVVVGLPKNASEKINARNINGSIHIVVYFTYTHTFISEILSSPAQSYKVIAKHCSEYCYYKNLNMKSKLLFQSYRIIPGILYTYLINIPIIMWYYHFCSLYCMLAMDSMW